MTTTPTTPRALLAERIEGLNILKTILNEITDHGKAETVRGMIQEAMSNIDLMQRQIEITERRAVTRALSRPLTTEEQAEADAADAAVEASSEAEVNA
jgi:hypothetical protein